ncbi:SGNH/GDSL hydrolase family protein [Novosphingobium cyanobacteriorum]|uniref:SGNH/GDSL hydrolase family protein n=1 Tax=Novosphingobium cyanobacteriorum TaxID=3024215 RepID=A0ABT6CIH8_9SPHN|nr:SGNH/GDSL hydrolase family protein [Novosphingobium cyanobacteriorum]MDF8333627.1 SGNH/GDSL hydrolase family protein [Novosphingobium cyanobacteriorum]
MRKTALALMALAGVGAVTEAAQAQTAAPSASPAPPAPTAMVANPCALPRNPANDWPNLCKYQQANRALAARPRVVFMGDSITEFWITRAPGIFAQGAVDRGISGQTTPQMLVRFMQDVIALKPRVVHIMAGTNDVAGNTGPTSPTEYAANIRAMVELAQGNGIAVVIGSILPMRAFPWKPGMTPAPQVIALNAWLKDYARSRGTVYADYHSAMADADGGMKPGLAADGVHPDAAGYAIMEPIARAAIAEAEEAHR